MKIRKDDQSVRTKPKILSSSAGDISVAWITRPGKTGPDFRQSKVAGLGLGLQEGLNEAEDGLELKKERFNFLKSIVACDNLYSVDAGSEFSAEV